MKKILCLSDGFKQGGAERQLIGLAHFLQEKGYIVTLACYTDGIFYKELIDDYNLDFVILKPKANILSKIQVVYKFIKSKKIDWVIAYKDGATSIACISKLLGLKCNVIVSERNTTQHLSNREKFKFWLYNYADYIVPNSHSQESFIINHFKRLKSKICVITNFTDINKFVPIKYVEHKRISILTVGRIAQQKNILRYLKVVKQLSKIYPNIRFKWIGDVSIGQEAYYDECIKNISKNNLSDIFEIKPATQNIKEEYDRCDIFCLPSLYEGYPNVICEAMACGKPILCSNVCDNPFIVEDGVNGFLFNPEDEKNMFDQFQMLLSRQDIQTMGESSREISLLKCSEHLFISKYIQLIESK